MPSNYAANSCKDFGLAENWRRLDERIDHLSGEITGRLLRSAAERERAGGADRASLVHWLLGYIQPYPGGNGRVTRFLMNAMLASGGYPWTVIRVEDRDAYMKALESASVQMNTPLSATARGCCVSPASRTANTQDCPGRRFS